MAVRDAEAVGSRRRPTHEFNPIEPVWSHLKRSLADLARRNFTKLTALVKTGLSGCTSGPGSSTASSPAQAWTSRPPVTPTIKDR
jgi:hypothetical protein